ncbi:MAG TPA: c-type cytochrome [Candidatus Acidoferrum sp.]|nr:c-type cytochrome [Candidatus Acidoferrum sp.]
MRLRQIFIGGAAGLILAHSGLGAAEGNPTNIPAVSQPVYVPDTSRQNEPLPDGVLAWDSLSKETNVSADAVSANFVFYFTNIAAVHETVLVTNVTTLTNITAVTNSSLFWIKKISFATNFTAVTRRATNNVTRPVPVTIFDVHPSCGCTTAQLPPLPWLLPPGTNAQVGFSVNLAGRMGTLIKTANVRTDQGSKQLIFKITMLPPVIPTQTEAERTRALEMAKQDRQAIFRGECATCHVRRSEGRYGKPLYDEICAICHDSKSRASMVPDLHSIKTVTNADFWRTWIAHGKAGTLMPAFSTSDGGPLSDMQIASLVQYLIAAFPSQQPVNQ